MTTVAPRPRLLVLLGLGVAAALPGCGSGGGGGAEVSSATLVPEASTTTTSAPPVTAATTSTSARRATTTVTAARAVSTTSTAATRPRPKVVQASQGDRVVAVFVASGSTLSDPSFARARARLKAIGYAPTSTGETDCSQGAREALPELREYSMALEFANQADASRFAALYGPVLGTVAVTVYCAD